MLNFLDAVIQARNYYWPLKEEETKAQTGDRTCPETHGQSCLIPGHIPSTETTCFSLSFIGSLLLLQPFLLQIRGALSWACFSSLCQLSLDNLTHFFVFNNRPCRNTATLLSSARAPLLSSRPFPPTAQGTATYDASHMTRLLSLKTCSSSQTPYFSKIT